MGNADFSVMQRSGMLVNSLKIYIKFNLNHMLKVDDVLSLLGLVSSWSIWRAVGTSIKIYIKNYDK